MEIVVRSARERDVPDAAMERLLWEAYVEGGFTEPERAAQVFAPAAIRARGEVLCAWRRDPDELAGMVIVVPHSSPARRLAADGEAEMHLLATSGAVRRMGVGRALVHAGLERARDAGLSRMLLWTQTSMEAAQRLYAAAGFARVPARDFEERGRRFLVFAVALAPAHPAAGTPVDAGAGFGLNHADG